MNKRRIIIVSIALCGIGLAVAMLTHKRTAKSEIMTEEEADRLVQRLKKSLPGPADDATREKIDRAINDFARKGGAMANGEWLPYPTKASIEINSIGQVTIPQLIDAAANHESPTARGYSLARIHDLHERAGGDKFAEYLPIFIRSLWDEDASIREGAVTLIGEIARKFNYYKKTEELKQVIPYLTRALADDDENTRTCAGEYLFRIGREDLVPKELVDKNREGDPVGWLLTTMTTAVAVGPAVRIRPPRPLMASIAFIQISDTVASLQSTALSCFSVFTASAPM